MLNDFIQKGNKIKIDIELDPSNISIYGIIDNIDDTLLEIIIDGTYIQNAVRNATCIIPGDIKTIKFETIILGSKNNRLYLAIPTNESIGVLQRRKHVRSPIDLYVNCCFVGFNEKKVDIDQYYTVKLTEISSGGVRINSHSSLPLGSILVFEMLLDNEPVMLTIKVLRCLESLDRKTFEIGCEFVGLDNSMEQKIMSYCFKLQKNMYKELKSVGK